MVVAFTLSHLGFNTQPRGGGCPLIRRDLMPSMSFNTQPRGGGCNCADWLRDNPTMFQHTAARRRLRRIGIFCFMSKRFQHTAARRRLLINNDPIITIKRVSTHSRAEAAA